MEPEDRTELESRIAYPVSTRPEMRAPGWLSVNARWHIATMRPVASENRFLIEEGSLR